MNLEISELSIVFVGELNPVIIQPSWLALKGLIQPSEGESANISIIHNEVCKFGLDWAEIEITRKKFIIRTTKSTYFNVIRDLSSSIFSILKETPLVMVGINHGFHYQANQDEYVAIGDSIAPFNKWPFLNEPRLLEIEMQEKPRLDGINGHYRVKIQPSTLIHPHGIHVSINDHIDAEEAKDAKEILTHLNNSWEESLTRSKNISESIWQNHRV